MKEAEITDAFHFCKFLAGVTGRIFYVHSIYVQSMGGVRADRCSKPAALSLPCPGCPLARGIQRVRVQGAGMAGMGEGRG